jgi:hypothetical protein
MARKTPRKPSVSQTHLIVSNKPLSLEVYVHGEVLNLMISRSSSDETWMLNKNPGVFQNFGN